jgi:hypothetical protein
MTWGNPSKLEPVKPKPGKKITPEDLAKSGSEDGHQAALFCWAASELDRYPQLQWMFAIPNGGSRHIAEAVKFVGTGTRAGVPDIMLPVSNNKYHGMFIEMKVGKNKTSKVQDEWIDALRANGYYVVICYSWEEARDRIIAYLENKI